MVEFEVCGEEMRTTRGATGREETSSVSVKSSWIRTVLVRLHYSQYGDSYAPRRRSKRAEVDWVPLFSTLSSLSLSPVRPSSPAVPISHPPLSTASPLDWPRPPLFPRGLPAVVPSTSSSPVHSRPLPLSSLLLPALDEHGRRRSIPSPPPSPLLPRRTLEPFDTRPDNLPSCRSQEPPPPSSALPPRPSRRCGRTPARWREEGLLVHPGERGEGCRRGRRVVSVEGAQALVGRSHRGSSPAVRAAAASGRRGRGSTDGMGQSHVFLVVEFRLAGWEKSLSPLRTSFPTFLDVDEPCTDTVQSLAAPTSAVLLCSSLLRRPLDPQPRPRPQPPLAERARSELRDLQRRPYRKLARLRLSWPQTSPPRILSLGRRVDALVLVLIEFLSSLS